MPSIVHAEQYQLLGKISFWWNHSTEKYTNHNIRFLPTEAKSNRYKAYIYIPTISDFDVVTWPLSNKLQM